MTRINRFLPLNFLLLAIFALPAQADELQDANKLYKAGQTSLALDKVGSILARNPKDAQARFLKGTLLAESGKADEAIAIFRQLTIDFPAQPEPYNNLAAIYASQGEYEKAKNALESALRTHPSYATAHANLGDIYAKMASQAYDKALQLDRSKQNSSSRLTVIREMPILASRNADTRIQMVALDKAAVQGKPDTPATTTPAKSAEQTAPTAHKPDTPSASPVKAETNASDEVLKAVHNWAKAWSARNADKYLAMYASDFKTPNNEPRAAWEKQRRERIAKPQPINVSIALARVTLNGNDKARASFVQGYQSGSLKSTTRKTLEMVRVNGTWQIQAELTGAGN